MKKKRILVVDDEPSITSVLTELLTAVGGYEVRACNDPMRVMEALVDFHPDLLLLDILMPGLDGGDLLARVRAREEYADLPAIFLTGLVSEAEVGSREVQLQGQPVLAKPCDPMEILAAVAAKLPAGPEPVDPS